MIYPTAVNVFWCLQCPCEASFQVMGSRIVDEATTKINCPNCGERLDDGYLFLLKRSVNSLNDYQCSINDINEAKRWHVEQPK